MHYPVGSDDTTGPFQECVELFPGGMKGKAIH